MSRNAEAWKFKRAVLQNEETYNNNNNNNNNNNLLIYSALFNILDDQKRITTINNGNRTEWSPIRSVIIRVITKSDDRAAGVRFVYHEYDYRQNWTTRSSVTN